MGIFSRLFKVGQAEANSAIDLLEDPIKMTEQAIRDMKKQLGEALQGLAEVKAMEIRARGDVNKYNETAKSYENKAMLILKKMQDGGIDAADADRLASEALAKKEDNVGQANMASKNLAMYEKSTDNLEKSVRKMKSNVSKWENELKTLKARVKVSAATKNINKHMAQIDSSSTVAMLEKMKDKVAEDEALAQSYGEIAGESQSLDDEIDSALDGATSSQSLEDLKKKMGM